MSKRKKSVIQRHHIVYADEGKGPEVVVLVYQGEHWAITQLQRRRKISKGFIEALEYWIDENRDKAVSLSSNSITANQ